MSSPGVTRLDVVLACALAALGVVEVALPLPTVMGEGSALVAALLACVSGLALIVRRNQPLAVLAVVLLPTAVLSVFGSVLVLFYGGLGPMTVAVYSVVRYGSTETRRIGAAMTAAAMAVFATTGVFDGLGQLLFPLLVLAIAGLIGWLVAQHHHQAVSSEQRARTVEATSREQTLAALAEERARIARELHDIVAHTVTAIVVQAGAAKEVVHDDPDYVRASLDRIRQTGSEALDEMRRVVVLLRDPDDPQPVGPQPGLADLERLVKQASCDQTLARLDVTGEPRVLPAGADLAAYRIVQEALTNARRHAEASKIQVRVHYGDGAVELEVTDNGIGQATDTTQGSGHGLIGMRERLGMYGGDLHISSGPGAGFHLRAVLPLEIAQ